MGNISQPQLTRTTPKLTLQRRLSSFKKLSNPWQKSIQHCEMIVTFKALLGTPLRESREGECIFRDTRECG